LIGLEVADAERAATSLDLQRVEEMRRAVTWARTAGMFFPGLSVRGLRKNPASGSMQGRRFGPGRLWRVLSPPLQATYEPTGHVEESARPFSVMLQLRGSTIAVQGARNCQLREGEICLIDECAPFQLEVSGELSQFMIMQMPRWMALYRYPFLRHRTATAFQVHEPGARLLRQMLLGVLDCAETMHDDQCAVTLVAVAQLLGLPDPPDVAHSHDLHWRTRAALAFIDSELCNPGLNADQIAAAQGVSRRWLDEILLKTVGQSVSGLIWARRLEQAAADLCNPRHTSRSVTQIAFANGFESAAHFTRTFKRHFHRTPREWRRKGGWHLS
jgi:AraC-like DNA-binding protein